MENLDPKRLENMSIRQIIQATPPSTKPNMLVGYIPEMSANELAEEHIEAVKLFGNDHDYTQALLKELRFRGIA